MARRPRPVIAVTGADSRFPIAWWATRFQLWLAGAKARRLTPSTAAACVKEPFDGLIIGGGSDIDPRLYGGDEAQSHKLDLERDRFELEIIQRALRTQLPIMGICRGAQLLNVVRGGSLYGDIRALRRLTSNRHTPFPVKHAISVREGRLFGIVRKRQWRINSLHHQAVQRPGEALAIAARDRDHFVQAIESTDEQYILGVQWHPEYLPYIPAQRRIFRALVAEASKARPQTLEAANDAQEHERAEQTLHSQRLHGR
jgi:putative glutamine amidotransferase